MTVHTLQATLLHRYRQFVEFVIRRDADDPRMRTAFLILNSYLSCTTWQWVCDNSQDTNWAIIAS